MSHKKILVTGASGFLGKHLVPFLVQNGYGVRAATRFPDAVPQVESVRVVDFTRAELDWAPLIEGIDSIVHLAGAAHTLVTDETYNTVNHLATRSLAITVAKTGVHFIQVSSIAAQSGPVSASILTEQDVPTPVNAYGISKLLAEIAVRDSGVPFTILRPVVVYGLVQKEILRRSRRLRACRYRCRSVHSKAVDPFYQSKIFAQLF